MEKSKKSRLNRRRFLKGAAVGAAAFAAGPVVNPQEAFAVGPALASPVPANVQLSLCLSTGGGAVRTRPLLEGRVKPDAIDLTISSAFPSEMFWRQLQFAEFDISEMSVSSLLIAIAKGDTRWVGIPVFSSRRFMHTGILVRKDRGIERPEDLKGKRVAVPEYQQTSALWSRGVLQDEFGVSAYDIDWYMERTAELSHAGATGFQPPQGLKLQYIPEQENIGTMMVAGKIDAVLEYVTDPNLVDRSTVDLRNHPDVRPLFPDPAAEAARYYKKTGFFPINHCVVFQRHVVEKHPWAILNMFKAFDAAKTMVHQQTRELAAVYFDLNLVPTSQKRVLDVDPYPYGVKANRAMLDAVTRYSYEQGLTPRVLKLEEVFHPATLDL